MSTSELTVLDEIQRLHARIDALEAKQPPEALYSLPQAALLLYCGVEYVKALSYKHREALSPPRYRWDARHISHRMLTASDLAVLRSKLLRPTRKRMTTEQLEALARTG